MKTIYLDNAASTPMDPEVFEHMKPYFLEQFGNPSSTHSHGRNLRNVIEEARRTIANCLGANPSEICFTSGGTEADNMAIMGVVKGMGVKHIISSPIEHHAVTHTIELLEKEGLIEAHWLDIDAKGHIDYGQLEAYLKQYPASLVSLMHANNEIGTLHDLQAIGKLCLENEAILHSDTVQSITNFRYNLAEMPVHFITASAHKFYGPKGIGFLYMKKGVPIPSLIHGGGQERNHRAGTEDIASIAGMAYAFEKCYANFEAKNNALWELKSYAKQQFETHFPDVQFNGETEKGKSIPTVLNVLLPCGEQDCMLLFNLDIKGISLSGGSACNSGAAIGSHVLRHLGLSQGGLMNSIRVSFGTQNTKEEIDFLIGQLKEIVKVALV